MCMAIDIPTTRGVMSNGEYVDICTECWKSPIPQVVCLCGSTRFFDEFAKTNMELTLEGKIVLSIGCDTHHVDSMYTAEQKRMLDRLHKRKIELSDMILVLNVNGYIGDSTKSEIEYALASGKPVLYKYPTQ